MRFQTRPRWRFAQCTTLIYPWYHCCSWSPSFRKTNYSLSHFNCLLVVVYPAYFSSSFWKQVPLACKWMLFVKALSIGLQMSTSIVPREWYLKKLQRLCKNFCIIIKFCNKIQYFAHPKSRNWAQLPWNLSLSRSMVVKGFPLFI